MGRSERRLSRRDVLRMGGVTAAGGALAAAGGRLGLPGALAADERGQVTGPPLAAQAGMDVLASGGNAVDAVVAAALVGAVVSINNCGIGGYGGHMVIAPADGQNVTAIDFNSAAPAAARPDMYPLDERGRVRDRLNEHGWLAAGVPGTLAGVQLALDRCGSRPLREVAQPAIRLAREGFPVSRSLVAVIRGARAELLKTPAAARLLLVDGEPPAEGSVHRNPELAAMLQTLADRGSVETFYRGDIAQRIAEECHKRGGLITVADLAAYRAREMKTLRCQWNGFSIHTAPLTAGGATVLQAIGFLKALSWPTQPATDPRSIHTLLEALRVAWGDRLRLLGDPEQVRVPLDRLLSDGYASEVAARVRAAVQEQKPVPVATDGRPAGGTLHLNAVDAHGLMVALTLTHGNAFGAQVAVEGLGLLLGHGMLRFDPRPGRPNSPGPGKRPLHNMCPTVVLRDGKPAVALGAGGGRRIVSAVFEAMANFAGRGLAIDAAVAAPGLHTEGGLEVTLNARAPAADETYLREVGYQVRRGATATVTAAAPVL
jgi:gamma-glutamyltranspeptidase/glutathione hydrolase